MPPISKKLKDLGAKPPPRKRTEPLWKGPEQDGITFSLLSRFLCCRERFRLRVIEGLKPADQFNHRIEYGQMWHVCEEALAKLGLKGDGNLHVLTEYCQELCKKYRTAQEQVQHWYNVCKVQFPLYVEHWAKQPDVTGRTPLVQEHVFDVPYTLPSGRIVRLRGKWDSVDILKAHTERGKKFPTGLWVQENKTKGDVNPVQLERQLTFDLQTMLYMVALIEGQKHDDTLRPLDGSKRPLPVLGVRYNVVRRPLSGGKGSIVRHKATKNKPEETHAEFYARVVGTIKEDPTHFFIRWKCEVTAKDIQKFRRECFDPILEQLCDWYNAVTQDNGISDPFRSHYVNGTEYYVHWRHPFGVWNVLDEGGSSDVDEFLATGSEVGLVRDAELFGELR